MKWLFIPRFSKKTFLLSLLLSLFLSSTGRSSTNILVTSFLDNGAGTLRQALLDNATLGGGNTILLTNLSGTIILTSGALYIYNTVSIIGPGAPNLIINGNHNSSLFVIHATNATVNISALTLSNGYYMNYGTNGYAAGISQLPGSGQLTISNCLIVNNSGGGSGGGLYTGGNLLLVNSTIAGNSSELYGGGIGCFGPTNRIYNCSILENTVSTTCCNGGGIACSGETSISCCTITSNYQNSGCGSGGGIYSTGNTYITNTIVAINRGASGPDVSGVFQSGGFNLIGTTNYSSGFTNGVNYDQAGALGAEIFPSLGAYGYYGGPTPLMPLLPGSRGIDQGRSAGLTTDQRGKLRPNDLPWVANAAGSDGSDIGAYEYDAPGPGTYIMNLVMSNVTHTFNPGQPSYVIDTISFDHSGLTNLDLSQYGNLTIRLFATNGQQLIVNPPAAANSKMSFQAYYHAVSDTFSNVAVGTLSLENFSGALPSRSFNYFSTGGAGNMVVWEAQESFVGSVAFSAFSYSFRPIDNPTNAPKTFATDAGNVLQIYYTTSATTDPGQFVTFGPLLKTQLVVTNGSFSLKWPGRTNQFYQIQSSTNVTGGNWQNVGAPIQGNGLTNSLPVATSGSTKLYYRLSLLPP